MTASSEFPALQEAAQVIDQLDGHRQRQALAFLAERYGWNLQPAAKKITPTPNPSNRAGFAAVEQLADLLDGLNAAQQGQAVAFFAARYGAKVGTAYKPPAGGFKPRRKFSR